MAQRPINEAQATNEAHSPEHEQSLATDPQPLLTASNISFGYTKKPRATELVIADFTGEISAGEVVALTGPSGRGKSTLLYVLGLLMKPSDGTLLVQGRDITGISDRERAALRAHTYGFVFQDAALDATRTVIDNVVETALYRGESRAAAVQRAQELLDTFGVGLRGEHKPGEISGGQAQRIALCRALLADPPLLLADEPTGNLDAESAQVVLAAMRNHAALGAGVVIATHDRTVMDQCDRRIEL